MVGNEKGFFKDLKLQYTVADNQPARYAAFQNGDFDILTVSVDEFAQNAERLHGTIILVTDTSYGGDGIVVRPDIKSPSQLKGKRIAFARATPSHYLLYKVLQSEGLSPADIKQVMVDDPGQAGQAFIGGSVDAAVTWEPFLSEVEKKGNGRVLLTTRDYPTTIVDILIASDRLAQNPDLLRKFLDGWLESVDYIKQHPDESTKIIGKGLGIKSEDAAGTMAGLRFADRQSNKSLFDKKDPSRTKLAELLKEAAAFWRSQGVASAGPGMERQISESSAVYFNP